ncbi:MAG: Cation diffusion facilitator transporter [Acidimicrobiales bacterium]|nr:Cation diffusion facilitator transporter [Acidimicrobiales bacterium]
MAPDGPPDADHRSRSGRHAKRDQGHGTKAVIAALLANAAIAVAKLVGFAVTGSSSMLAEGVHSIADSGNQCLLLLGGKRARKAADETHPFGYGRERYFWAFVVALVLFSLGSMFAVYEGIHKVQHPHAIDKPQWALGILGFALVMETLSFRTAIHEADAVRGDATYRQFIRRAKIPEIPVVLLEDLGALIGLAFAATGVAVAETTHQPKWDGYGTLAIGALLGIIALILAVEMKSLLIGEAAGRKQQEAIRAAIEIEPDVIQLIHLRTQHLGPDELLVGAKVELLHDLTMVEVADAIDRIESNVRANVPEARVMYIEPDVHRDHRARTYVAEHEGRLDHADPLWAEITGEHRAIDPDQG